MGKIYEAIMLAILSGQHLKTFKKEVVPGEVAEFDVFFSKETEYMVKGKVLKGRGTPTLSLVDDTGSVVPIHSGAAGNYFSVIPQRDGLYHIRADVKQAGADREPATLKIVLSTQTMPGYARLHIAAASSVSTRRAFTDDELPKGQPARGARAKRELEGAGAMTCCGLSEKGKRGQSGEVGINLYKKE